MAVYTPLGGPFDVTDAAAQQITFDPLGAAAVTAMGSFAIENLDTANTVWYAFDQQAVVEAAAPYTANNFQLRPGRSATLNRATYAFISVICDAGLTATVQVLATQGAQS